MGKVTTSITVQFGGAADALHLSAEVDGRSDGLNNGDTSFQPGDTAFFLVYKSDAVVLDTPIASAGIINTQDDVDIVITEFVSFANTKAGTVNKPVKDGTLVVKWLGKDLGAINVDSSGVVLSASEAGIAVAKLTYTTTAKVFTINAPSSVNGETTYPILIVITGND